MPLKKPSEFYIKNPNTSLDEVKENATPEKVERISEAFNSFKTNFDHIQALTDFTNTFDTFKSNVEKVDTLSESVEDIREGIKDLINKEDLDGAMTAQLLFVEESIRNVQDKVKTLNSKSILDIKNQMLELYKSKFKGIEGGADKYNEELKKANQKFQKDLEKHVEKFGEKGKGNAVTVKDVYGDSLPTTIKLLGARLKTIEKEEEAEVINKTNERRKIAETDMTREQHIKLLEIVRDNGISLKEGAMGVKVYYEIAKAAYLEGVANAHRL